MRTEYKDELILEERVLKRMSDVARHIEAMEGERQGYGPDAMREVDLTRKSYLRGLDTLFSARQVWIDGGTGLSFGGVMNGGVIFGMIAREEPSEFQTKPVSWTFHS